MPNKKSSGPPSKFELRQEYLHILFLVAVYILLFYFQSKYLGIESVDDVRFSDDFPWVEYVLSRIIDLLEQGSSLFAVVLDFDLGVLGFPYPPPGFYILQYFVSILTFNLFEPWQLILVSWFVSLSLLSIGVYLLSRRFVGKEVALFSACLIFIPNYTMNVLIKAAPTTFIFSLVFIPPFLISLLDFMKKKTWQNLAISSLAITVLTFMHYYTGIFAILIACILFIYSREKGLLALLVIAFLQMTSLWLPFLSIASPETLLSRFGYLPTSSLYERTQSNYEPPLLLKLYISDFIPFTPTFYFNPVATMHTQFDVNHSVSNCSLEGAVDYTAADGDSLCYMGMWVPCRGNDGLAITINGTGYLCSKDSWYICGKVYIPREQYEEANTDNRECDPNLPILQCPSSGTSPQFKQRVGIQPVSAGVAVSNYWYNYKYAGPNLYNRYLCYNGEWLECYNPDACLFTSLKKSGFNLSSKRCYYTINGENRSVLDSVMHGYDPEGDGVDQFCWNGLPVDCYFRQSEKSCMNEKLLKGNDNQGLGNFSIPVLIIVLALPALLRSNKREELFFVFLSIGLVLLSFLFPYVPVLRSVENTRLTLLVHIILSVLSGISVSTLILRYKLPNYLPLGLILFIVVSLVYRFSTTNFPVSNIHYEPETFEVFDYLRGLGQKNYRVLPEGSRWRTNHQWGGTALSLAPLRWGLILTTLPPSYVITDRSDEVNLDSYIFGLDSCTCGTECYAIVEKNLRETNTRYIITWSPCLTRFLEGWNETQKVKEFGKFSVFNYTSARDNYSWDEGVYAIFDGKRKDSLWFNITSQKEGWVTLSLRELDYEARVDGEKIPEGKEGKFTKVYLNPGRYELELEPKRWVFDLGLGISLLITGLVILHGVRPLKPVATYFENEFGIHQ